MAGKEPMKYQEVLWREVKKAYTHGGEVRIIFIKRQNERIPVVRSYIDHQISCDKEIVIDDED